MYVFDFYAYIYHITSRQFLALDISLNIPIPKFYHLISSFPQKWINYQLKHSQIMN